MVVHQLVPTFTEGDATGQAAVNFRWLMRRLGVHSELYAGEVPRHLHSLVRPMSHLRPRPEDLVLYHHGIASWLSGAWLHLPCRKGIVFHNITPARFYAGQPLEEALVSGRAQLAAMAPRAEVAIGVSELNAAELRAAGYRNVHVVPLVIEAQRFGREWADPAMAQRLARGAGTTVVSVSRVMPHKRVEDLLALHAELLRIDSEARLLVVGGYDAGSKPFRALKRRADSLSGVEFLGRVSHAELVAAYRSAHVYVSMSEHEGFGVPLIEAMAAEVPVLAYGAAAVPRTLNGAGIAFDEKNFGALAELVREVASNRALRERILRGQSKRLRELSPQVVQERLGHALAPFTKPFIPSGRRSPPFIPSVAKRSRGTRAKPRVGFLVQRYGEVTGGAEQLARLLVERLRSHWDITVLTTCARDHLTWANEFPEGESREGGVRVLRFPTIRGRRMKAFNALSRSVFGCKHDRLKEEHWVAEQGPLSPALFRHLSDERAAASYDGFVAFTYLYASTAWGLPLIADRAILVPTTHEEPPLDLELYRDAYLLPRALFCLTPEEQALIHRRFPGHAPTRVVGAGVEPRAAAAARFRKKYGVRQPYLLYVGRLEEGKGLGELLKHHAALLRSSPAAPDLVLAGSGELAATGHGVRALGRVSDQDKVDGLAGALAVVVPSQYESLSLLALEAFAQGTPVLANGKSQVLVGHLARSGAGRTYLDASSFAAGLEAIRAKRAAMSRKALAYAKKHPWSAVVGAYREQMAQIMASRVKAQATG